MTLDFLKDKQTVIAHGRGSKDLAEEISKYLGIPIIDHKVDEYPDGETNVSIHENVRGKHVLFIGSRPDPKAGLKPSDVAMEYAFAGDALRRSKVRAFDFLIPYLPFGQKGDPSHYHFASSAQLVTDTIMQVDPRIALSVESLQSLGQKGVETGSPFARLHASNIKRLAGRSSHAIHAAGDADEVDPSSIIHQLIEELPQDERTVIMHGRGSGDLAEGISRHLNIPIADHAITESPDGETRISIRDNVRGKNVIFIGSSPNSDIGLKPNDAVMEYPYIGGALRSAGASAFRFLVPYMPYARQDRTKGERVALTSKRVIDTIMQVNPSNIMLVEPHTEYLEQAFPSNNPPDILWFTNLFAANIAKFVRDTGVDHGRVVSIAADHGTKTRATQLSKILRNVHAIKASPKIGGIADKNRLNAESIELMSFTGDASIIKAVALLPDDILASGTTLIGSAKATKALGASIVVAIASHGSLTRGADNLPKILHELNKPDSAIDILILTDTLPIPESVRNHPRVLVLNAAECMALAAHNAWGIPYPGTTNGQSGSLRGFNEGLREPLTPQSMPPAMQKQLLLKLAP